LRGEDWESPPVAHEGHAQPMEGLSPTGNAGAAEIYLKPWWGKAEVGCMATTRVHATLKCMGGGWEHDNQRKTWKTPANPLVRRMLYNNRQRSVDLNPNC